MRKMILATIVVLASASILSGCADKTGEPIDVTERVVELNDGREVPCVYFRSGYAGGISCDWDNAS